MSKTSGASPANADIAAANKIIASLSNPPTKIGISAPLKSKPPKGKTVVYLKCLLPQCTEEANGATAAVKAVGWNIKIISYDSSNPAQLVAGMKTALQFHPVGVINSGLPESAFASVIPAYTKAKVPIVMLDTGPAKLPKIILANIYGAKDLAQNGQAIAAWFVVDSGGQGKALLVDVPGFPILADLGKSFSREVSALCSACKVSTLSLSIAQLEGGQLNSSVTAALQKDPTINYLIGEDGAFFDAMPASLSAAGLSKVKVASMWGDATTEADIKTGTIAAVTGYAVNYQGWQAIDALLRHVERIPLPSFSEGATPTQLLTSATLKTPTNDYEAPANYPALFKKLWKVG